MTKTLILMRHCKSSWEGSLTDEERPLNPRGQNAATALGDWLRRFSLAPDEILCSSAARTIETTDRLSLGLPYTPIPALYMASSDQIVTQIERATGDTLLLVAHNPGIGDFADRLAASRPNHTRFMDYPSGATTVFQCDIDEWSHLKFGQSTITQFITPKELTS
jgi:phosphohistidine phosphatase